MRSSSTARVVILAMTGVMLASAASAGTPDPAHCTFPIRIGMVGRNGVVPDPYGQFQVHLADNTGSGANCANQTVVIYFGGAPDMRFCSDQLDPNLTTDCGARIVCGTTDGQGNVKFIIIGASTGTSPGPSSVGPTLQVYGNPTNSCVIDGSSVLLESMSASAFDLEGAAGIGANDLSIWLNDYVSSISGGQPWARSDYDNSGAIGANDLSLWLTAFAAAGSLRSCAAAYCP